MAIWLYGYMGCLLPLLLPKLRCSSSCGQRRRRRWRRSRSFFKAARNVVGGQPALLRL